MESNSIPTRSVAQALTGRKLTEERKVKVMKNIIQANEQRHLNGILDEEKTRLTSIRPSRTGKKHSETTKAKMSEAHQGKVMSVETRQKMSEARKGKYAGKNHPLYGHVREDMKGESNPNWNGGITPLYKQIRETIQYKQWRQTCFERDNYTCQLCGQRGDDLHVDHITTYASILADNQIKSVEAAIGCEQLWDVGNGRTLCITCHRNTDTYGRPLSQKSV